MPELPEVETTRRGIEPHLLNNIIEKLVVRQRQLRWPIPADLPRKVAKQRILSVERRAKYLLIRIESGTMIAHLGMSGSMRVVQSTTPPEKHDHFDLLLSSGKALRFTDPRRFGCLLWIKGEPEKHKLIASLGPEPLTDDFDGERLHRLSRGRKVAVKQFIMDNAVVVGVGNIYASEALFAAGIHPVRAAGRISKQRYERLAEEIKIVLAKAVEQGGTTLKDFVGGDGKPGYFKQKLKVYGRAGEECVECQTPISENVLGQRNTFFCKNCQR